jgi:hypothetical protein
MEGVFRPIIRMDMDAGRLKAEGRIENAEDRKRKQFFVTSCLCGKERMRYEFDKEADGYAGEKGTS